MAAPPGLMHLQAMVHGVLRQETPVETGALMLGCDPDRLAIYRRFVDGHIKKVLAKDYRITRSILPPDVWQRLVDDYFHERPASSWELNAACEAFPGFLAERQEAGARAVEPFHVALARYEWERFATYMHLARVPDASDLDAPTLNPTLSILELTCPVVAFVMRWNAGEHDPTAPLPTVEQGPERVLMFRSAADSVCYPVANDDLLFALKVTYEGLDPIATAEAAGLPADLARAAMDEARRIGLVIG